MTRLRMWWAPPVSVWVVPAGGGPGVRRRVWVWCANLVCAYVYRVSCNQRGGLKNWNETEFSLCSVLFLLSSLARQERDRIRPHAGHHTSKGVLHLVSDSGDLGAIWRRFAVRWCQFLSGSDAVIPGSGRGLGNLISIEFTDLQ